MSRALPVHAPLRKQRQADKAESPKVRLFDRIKSGEYQLAPYDMTFFSPAHWEAYAAGIKEDLAGAELIVADNIDDFIFSTYPVDTGYGLTAKEIPNLVPPFARFFIDIRPADPLVRKHIKEFGALVTAMEIPEDSPRRKDFGPAYSPRFLFAWRAIFLLDRVAFCTIAHQIVVSDEHGNILSTDVQPDPTVSRIAQQTDADASDLLSSFAGPVLTAISFMNCRNVTAAVRQPDSGLSRAHKKRTGEWLSKYRVIDIVPVSRLIREAVESNGGEGRASAKAAHIIRGHFKRYSEKGLFGKTRGTFFWSSQARGSLTIGERSHEYRIRTDGEGKC